MHTLLLNRQQTHQLLMDCIPFADQIRLEVAWARWDHPVEQALRQHAHAVRSFLVGTSFGRT